MHYKCIEKEKERKEGGKENRDGHKKRDLDSYRDEYREPENEIYRDSDASVDSIGNR